MSTIPVDFAQVQGLIRFGYGALTEASFLLLTIRDAQAARAWLRAAPFTNAVGQATAPDTALQVAFTRAGLERLGVPPDTIAEFSMEFRSGMSGEQGRSRLLGDTGANAPQQWDWGGDTHAMPDLLVMVYARPGHLRAFSQAVQGPTWSAAFDLLACLPTSDLGGYEPFGFADGVSQPTLDWDRRRFPTDEQLTYRNDLTLGEIVLGYPNEYGHYTDRPLVSAADPLASALPVAEDQPALRDVGRDGCYLVLRTLAQDVQRFWQFINTTAHGQTDAREALASAMVGRTREGSPLVPLTGDAIPGLDPRTLAQNRFTFDSDPLGTRCPFGAHIRRANPRNADLPAPVHGLQRLVYELGLEKKTLHSDAKASTRFHRIVRRGREFGPRLSLEDALAALPDTAPRGLHFICLNANISRQFEFLQNAWFMSTKFDAGTDESDPLLGNRAGVAGSGPADTFSVPRTDGLRDKVCGMPQFVTVRGGAYFFLPSLPALRYFAADRL